MTTKTYALFDTHAEGPDEIVAQGGEVITCTVDADDIHRLVRLTEGFSTGIHRFQVGYYGEGEIAGKVSHGIVTAAHSLSKYVGEESTGYGFKAGDGGIFNNNAQVTATDPTVKQVMCDVILDCDALTCEFRVNGSSIAIVAIASGQTWYGAVGVGSEIAAGDISAYIITGANAFDFIDPVQSVGWYTETQGFGSLRMCAQTGFLTAGTDTPPYVSYAPDMLEFFGFATKRSCSVWSWSNQSSGATFGTLAQKNDKGQYDFMLRTDPRDAKVTVRSVPVGGTFADAFVVATANINAVSTDGEAILRSSLGDTLSTIQRQLQTRKFPPWVDEGIANRPYPILLGAVRQVAPLLRDEENRLWQLGDASINNIGVLRDQGDPLDPNASPPDYALTADASSLQTNVMPVGKLTGDFSSLGQQNQIDGAVDVLAGAGLFTTWTNPSNPPDGWTSGGGGSFAREGIAQGFPQNYVAQIVATDPWSPGTGKFGKWLKFASALLPGRTYNVVLKLRNAVGGPPSPVGGADYGIRILSALDNAPSSAMSPFGAPLQQPLWRDQDQYTFTYQVPAGGTRDLYVSVACATGATSAIVSFYGIALELLPLTQPEVPLQPMLLNVFMQNIIEQRLGLTSSDWVQQDAIDIDVRTGYDGIGYYTSDPVTGEAALRAATDSYCAVIFTDHLGRIRVRQLIDPDTISDGDIVASFNATNIQYPMNCVIDAATGLTTSMISQKNNYISTPTDFVSDTNAATGISYALRARFQQQGQFLAVATVPLAGYYAFAQLAPPLVSLFDNPDNAQTEINRVNALYSTTPCFYTFTVLFNGNNAQTLCRLIFGDGIIVTYDRYGLDNGKKMIVVDANVLPGNFSIEIVAWRPST